MSTRHVLLALLHVQPGTGYELAQSSTMATEPVWAATHSQIYPLLRKLEEDGLVESARGVRGQRLERIVYSITAAGERELREWQEQPVQYLPYRDPFRLWASFVNECSAERAFANIDEHVRRNRERARTMDEVADLLESGEHRLIRAREPYVLAEELDRVRRARSAMYRELARLADFEVESALRLREVAAELHPDVVPPPAPAGLAPAA